MAYDLTNFNAELAAVDPARSFTQSIDPAYGENEWSVAGYAITAGSDTAVQHGASEALYQLGYRFWTPTKTTRPDTLPAGGVTLARQAFVYPYINVFFNYGLGGTAQYQAQYNHWNEMLCWGDSRRPVGHAYPSIINAIEAEDGFFTANPSYIIGTPNVGQPSFNLDLTGADYDALVNRVAAHILPRLNAQKRHSIDPNDGSTWNTDKVFTFANDVAAVIAQTEPDVMLGLYAYAGHRQPATFPCPRLYVDIARGFNDLGIGYVEMGKQWAQVVPEFGLRCYGDIGVWIGWSNHLSAEYLADFAEHAADGAAGIRMETSTNWTKNVVAYHHWFRNWRDGTTTYQDALDDAVSNLYDGDSRVADLFNYWSTVRGQASTYTLDPAGRIIETMPDTEYRAEFERYFAFAAKDLCLHDGSVTAFSGRYFTGLERNLRAAKATEATGEIHDYVYSRVRANSNVINNGRPDLAFDADAHWDRFPAGYTTSDFNAALAEIKKAAARPSELDDTSLVVVDTQPYQGATVTVATEFNTENKVSFVFAGPGTVTVNYETGPDDVLTFGAGLHQFTISGKATTTWTGGHLFLSLFPVARMDPANDGLNRWLYIPSIVEGRTSLASDSRITLYTEGGTRWDIKEPRPPFSSGFDDPRGLPYGIALVHDVNTRGFHKSGNVNPYVSATPYKMLMPFALAQREFPNMIFNGAGQVPEVLDLTDNTAGQSDDTEGG